ncbi:YpzG family protein [Lederbergia sp. NSJ-179]|uniref:YpzG family protein n=1 Tax=Lederbergia sp. NSJ-179 TaxID=2931402 RepID=UPI001FCFAEEA|nr:YpzG family protein [Lederbergia sp. NSJ-179]MCJ7843326.1 YpzG family protein [Lederbergia sp. NSJ-179]
MTKGNGNTHLNRNLSPFNRGFYNPKKMGSQVNGQTEQSQTEIIRERDAVTRYKK